MQKRRRIDSSTSTFVTGLCGGIGENHFRGFLAEAAADNRAPSGCERGLINIKLVGIDGALDDEFAQSVSGGDENGVFESRFGVESEHHAAGGQVAARHFLDADRDGDLARIKAVVGAVGDCARGVKRGENALDGGDKIVLAAHIQKSVLLAGERRFRQILGGRRRAHGDGAFAARAVVQQSISGANFGIQIGRQSRRQNAVADGRRRAREIVGRINIGGFEFAVDEVAQTGCAQKSAVGVGGGRESVRHAHAGRGQFADEFAERGVFAADDGEVFVARGGERDDMREFFHRGDSNAKRRRARARRNAARGAL